LANERLDTTGIFEGDGEVSRAFQRPEVKRRDRGREGEGRYIAYSKGKHIRHHIVEREFKRYFRKWDVW
jgi:hypothetical protein